MDLIEYRKNAIRTESKVDDGFVSRLEHVAYGLKTEIGEILDAFKKSKFYGKKLDRVNVLEECGDAFWYLGILSDVMDWDLQEIMRNSPQIETEFSKTEEQIAWVIDAKLHNACHYFISENMTNNQIDLGYARDSYELKLMIGSLMNAIKTLVEMLDSTLEQVLDANINKLRKRFPEKFTEELAEVRDLMTERTSLESDLQEAS